MSLLFVTRRNTAPHRPIAHSFSPDYDAAVERDWYRRVMLKLADARESRPDEFLQVVDSELDGVILQMDELRRTGGMSGFSQKRALNMLNELRGRLERARNSHEVNTAFLELDEVRDLVDEAAQAIADRDDPGRK